MSFPLRYAKGNVLLGRGGEAAGLYRLAMTSYPYLPTGEKWTLQRRLQRLAHTIGADFSLWRVQRAYPAEQYVQHTAGLLDERHQEPQAWEAFLAGHRERLRELGSHIPECYLAVSLAGGAPAGWGRAWCVVSIACAAVWRSWPGSASHHRSPGVSSPNCRRASSVCMSA